MTDLLRIIAAIHGHASDLEALLLAERARRYEAECRLVRTIARNDQLEIALTDERTHVTALEHALAGASWALTEAGIDVTGGEPS